ncbi:hypothetical protein HYX09_05890 [Candidatus Woesearchaeota archaeon]|nr:hypothetical protein [Candidatus Woesearchaeota archaeon]
MPEIKIMNAKETKEMYRLLDAQFGCVSKPDYAFLINTKNRIFAVNREISGVELGRIRPNSIGMYFAEMLEGEIRLSIEGSQLIGPDATRNVVELDDEESLRLFRGEDISKETGCKGFVILKRGRDFLGTGKVKGGKILNFISKSRRINLGEA